MGARPFDDATLARLFTSGPSAVLILDDTATVVWASDAVADQLGYPPQDLVGTSVAALVHPDDAARAVTAASTMHRQHLRTRGMVYRLRHADGTWTDTLASAQPHEIDGRRYVQVVLLVSPMRLAASRALEVTLQGGSVADSLAAIATQVRRNLPGAFGFVLTDTEVAARAVVVGDLPPELAGVRPDGTRDRRSATPWAEAARTGRTVVAELDGSLPADVAAAAAEAGLGAVAVIPVADPGADHPLLIVIWIQVREVVEAVARITEDATTPIVKLLLERQGHLRNLRRAATTDPLTGLHNRAWFFPSLHEAISAHDTAVLYLDLDGFKPVNDELGHDAGDGVLIEISRRLRTGVPAGALVARLGGDEFAVAVPGATIDDGQSIARGLIDEVAQPIALADGSTVAIGASIGVALARRETLADDAVNAADTALLEAKNAGKGCVKVASTP